MNFKRICSMSTAVVVAISLLAGCGSTSGNTSDKTESSVKSTETRQSAQASEAKGPYTLKMLYTSAGPNSPIGESNFKKIEQETGVKMEVTLAPSANYNEKLQITFASGDMPDVVLFNDVNDVNLKANVENGNIIDINPYLQNAPNLMQWTLPESWKAVEYKGDDKKYLIVRSTLVRGDGFEVRKDWLDKLNIKVEDGKPVTLEQFTDILKRFSQDDPDGNGKNDTYGLHTSVNPDGDFVPLYSSFLNTDILGGAFGLTGWQKTTGEDYEYMDPKFSKKTDKFKKFLEYLSMVYQNKYADPDWAVMKDSQAHDNFVKGKYGVRARFPGHVKPDLDLIKKVNPEGDLIWISGIINPEAGKVTGLTYSSGAWGGFAVTRSSKKPDRVIEAFDYMLSDEFYADYSLYGGEGIGFTLADGKRIPTEEYKNPDPGHGIAWWPLIRRAKDVNVFLSLTLDETFKPRVEGWLKTAVDNAVISLDMGYVPKAALDPKFIDYKKRMSETIANIILGQAPSGAYDEAIAGWYENGGEAYVKEMNDYIKANNK